MRRAVGFRAYSAAVLASAVLLGCAAASAANDDGKVGMNAKAFLAECEKGVEFWCSNQIYTVDINDSLRHMAKNERKTHCLPKKGDGTNAERNAKIVAAVKGWFAQHPEEVAAKGDASGPILKAMEQLWPGACPG
jgi:hypothetical protein